MLDLESRVRRRPPAAADGVGHNRHPGPQRQAQPNDSGTRSTTRCSPSYAARRPLLPRCSSRRSTT
jgi:hypothetical protein